MEPKGFPETSVRTYHYTLRNTTEECRSHPLREQSLKTSTEVGFYLILEGHFNAPLEVKLL